MTNRAPFFAVCSIFLLAWLVLAALVCRVVLGHRILAVDLVLIVACIAYFGILTWLWIREMRLSYKEAIEDATRHDMP